MQMNPVAFALAGTALALTLALTLALPIPAAYAAPPEPERLPLLIERGIELLRAGAYDEAEAVFLQAAELDPEEPSHPYNAACACSLGHRPDDAFEHLEKALDLGFTDTALLLTDPDLASIREDERWTAIVGRIPRVAAPDITLPDLDGKPVSLSDFRGKVLLVDFWGTWCGWCVKMIPDLKRLHARYEGAVVILAIAREGGENGEETVRALRDFVAEKEIPYRVLVGTEESEEAFGGISGFPTSFLITADGRIALKKAGYSTADTLIPLFDGLLAEAGAPTPEADPDLEALARGQALAAEANPNERWKAVDLLAGSRSVDALPILIGLLDDPERWVADGVLETLARITGREPTGDRAAWTTWIEEAGPGLRWDAAEQRFLERSRTRRL